MKIGILCHASFGGSVRVATELAKQLANRGHQIHLFAYAPPFGQQQWRRGITLHTLQQAVLGHAAELHVAWAPAEVELLLSKVLGVIRQQGLDVLHFHYALPFAYIAEAVHHILGDAAPRLVGTLHGTDVVTHGTVAETNGRLRQAFAVMDCLTAVSHQHAQLAQKTFTLPQQPTVIPNFIRCVAEDANPRSSATGSHNRPLRLIHLSNFRAVKQTPMLARIFAKLRQRIEAELWLIGDGPEMGATQQILRQAGVEDDVVYWGLRPNVAGLLAQGDVLLVTSQYESFSLAALEGMSQGLVVVASRVGGLPELVVHNRSGFLLPPTDEAAFCEAVCLLDRERGRLAEMKTAVRQRAALFSATRAVAAYEAIYENGRLKNPCSPLPAIQIREGMYASFN
ncbi:MAG: N-acetyl-alpha-D-glucosaminyl L-malate synthase BshA [Chloroflexota bacterium]